MFFVQEGFTYRNFLMDMIAVFAFVVWFWLIIVIYGDLFRRHDISGWGKALWVLALVLTSYFGIFAYLITQGRGMAERNAQQAERARDELRPRTHRRAITAPGLLRGRMLACRKWGFRIGRRSNL